MSGFGAGFSDLDLGFGLQFVYLLLFAVSGDWFALLWLVSVGGLWCLLDLRCGVTVRTCMLCGAGLAFSWWACLLCGLVLIWGGVVGGFGVGCWVFAFGCGVVWFLCIVGIRFPGFEFVGLCNIV